MEIIVPKAITSTNIAIGFACGQMFPVCPACNSSGLIYATNRGPQISCGNVVAGGCRKKFYSGVGTIPASKLSHGGDLKQILRIVNYDGKTSLIKDPDKYHDALKWISDWTGLDQSSLGISIAMI